MNIDNYRKKAMMALLIALAVLAMLPAGAAFAQEGAQGEKTTVTQEFTYKEGEAPDIPSGISHFGQTLTLVSVSSPVASTAPAKTSAYTYQASVSYTPDQLSQAQPGAELTPVYGTGKRQVDREETIRDLPDNDVEKLPVRKVYSDTDGRGPGATVNGDLALAEVKYEVTGLDTDGLPNKYSAHVVYRGEETYSVLLYYTAEATYTGTVAEVGETTYTVVATYEGYEPAPAEGPEDSPASIGPDTGIDAGADVPYDAEADAPYDAGADASYDAGADGYSPADSNSGEDVLFIEDGDELAASAGAEAPSGKPSLLASLAGLPPIGVAALATIIAAALALVTLSVYNRRKARDEQ